MKNIVSTLKNKLCGLVKDRRGQTMTECALLVGFLAVVAVVFVSTSGNNVKASFANMNTKLGDAVADSGPSAGSPTPSASPAPSDSPTPSDNPAPSDNPSEPGDGGGSGGGGGDDEGGKDKKDKKDKDDKDKKDKKDK